MIFMLLGFPLGIIGVKGVSLDPELSSWRRYCCCSAVVISTIIMSGLILLRVSSAPPCKPLSTVGSKPLACKHLSVRVHANVFESLNLSNICNQIVTTALPFSEGLDDCSHSFIMSRYILFAHVWVHAAPEDVALRVITSAEWAAWTRVPGYWLPGHVWH